MITFLACVAFAFFVFCVVAERQYGPKPVKPAPPRKLTIADVRATIASAQKTLDDSLDLIYGRVK